MSDNNDLFEAKLDNATKELQSCQTQQNTQSCYTCPKCIGCELRATYVRTVYESMSKGEIGGFDF